MRERNEIPMVPGLMFNNAPANLNVLGTEIGTVRSGVQGCPAAGRTRITRAKQGRRGALSARDPIARGSGIQELLFTKLADQYTQVRKAFRDADINKDVRTSCLL